MDTPKKRLSMAKIKKRKTQLCLLYGLEKSWRTIQKNYYPEVSFQTLQAFADKKRGYIPASDKVREALDIYADHNPYRGLPRWYKRIPESVAYWTGKKEQIKGMYDDAKASKRDIIKASKLNGSPQ